jgi:Bacterial Ig-like domain (group 1)/Viral BACON domain
MLSIRGSRALAAVPVALFAFTTAAVLQAQSFYPIPALSFTKAFAGANPVAQSLMLSSTGAAFNYTAVASTFSGGSWLQLTPSSGVFATPSAVAVKINDVSSLSPGTYTGSVLFSSYPTPTITMTVPVTLIVAPAGGTYFDNTAGQLSFSLTPGGGPPPSQSIQIRNAGTGTLNWTGSVSTADGGNWLSISASAGTSPSLVTATVQTAALPGGGASSGTFVGQIAFQAAGSAVTVPVSVTVGANVFRQVNPISFSMPFAGANPLPQVVIPASTGTNFNFYIALVSTGTGGNWLQLSPSSGVLTTPEGIVVSVNASTLAAGTYTGEILFWAYPSNNLAITVPVTLTIGTPGTNFFDNLPGELSYSVTPGGSSPPQSFQIRNAGPGALHWAASASTADGGAWLALSASNGAAPSTLTATVFPNSLPGQGLVANTYCGQILLQTAGDIGTIPVCVVVGVNVFRQVNPISFTMPFAGANPLPQPVTLASTGTNFNFYVDFVSTGTGGAWLKTNPSSGVLATPQTITVSVNAGTLAAGTYTGELIFSAYPSNNLIATVPVTLNVAATGSTFFDNLPGALSFSLAPGWSPPSQSVQIRNGGTGTLSWTASASTGDGGAWLTVTPPSGTAPALLNVGIIPSALPNQGLIAGTYCGQVSLQTAGDTGTIPVCVTVGANVFGQVNPINFTMTAGGPNPLPQTLDIASTGTTNFNFYVDSVASGTGGNWLSVAPNSGVLSTPQAMVVSVNASTLAAGTYTAEVNLKAYPANNLALTVPVTLTIAPAASAYFDDLPGQLSFSLAPGNTPPPQAIQIRNAGSGSLPWAASMSTADGGNWLSVSPLNGMAPTQVTVSIAPMSLPGQGLIAGTFCGQVVFQAAGDTGTIPVCVAVGPNVFRQVNPLNFTMPFGGGNPLPQVITLASTGANFNFYNASVSTSKGGNWLSITPNAGVLATPQNIVVNINGAALAAGTYTGEIVLNAYPSNNLSVTVPVTLTVASCGPFFDSVQGQASFSFMPSTSNPPPQTVQIRPAGWGTLTWIAATSTSDGGNWLTVNPHNGSAPSTVSVGVVNAALPGSGLLAGTYTGQVVFQSAGSSVTIPVSVVIGTNVFTAITPLTFSMTLGGGNPPSQNFTATSTGSAFSFYFDSIATGGGGNWLQLSPNTGVQSTPKTITVSVNGAALLAGTYTGQVVLSQYPANTMTMTVPIYVTVTDPRVPASITATSGSPQTAVVTKPFPAPLVATVKDSGGNPVSGVLVTFHAPASGASATFACSGNTAITNSAGLATSQVFSANTVSGRYSVSATANALSTKPGFSLTNRPGPPASITASAGTPQSTTVNTPFATNLAATVKDVYGNPVGGATVTFHAPPSGASGTFAGGVNTAKTNAQGVATAVVFTANTIAGTYAVTATVASLSTSPGFVLTNLAGPPAAIAATGGTPQSSRVNTPFSTNLAATVTDAFGNPVPGATVTFIPPTSGASGTFAGGMNTAVTDAQGVATAVTFTANTKAGSYTVTATVNSLTTSPGFALANLPANPASLRATGGTPQSTPINTPFPQRLSATLRDRFGNPVPNVTITFNAPASGASGTFAGGVNTAKTNAKGVATAPLFTANGTVGSYTVTATQGSLTTNPGFALTNTAN